MSNSILLVISGSFNKIILKNSLNNDIKVIKISDKLLAKPFKIFDMIKSKDIQQVYFGTIDNSFQRFKFFLNFYIVILRKKGFLIDEAGRSIRFSVMSLLLRRMPKFFFEIMISLIILIFYFPIYFYYRWKFLKN